MSEWISVNERLPSESNPRDESGFNLVLVVFRGQVIIGYRISGEWRIQGSPSNFSNDIKYWMPLPHPPKDAK